jgi:photosystem II stability/assembly factor-like uncharacterized protein
MKTAAVLVTLAFLLFGPAAAGARTGAASTALADVDMVNTTIGWALTENALLRTTDGGRHWVDRTPPGLHTRVLEVGVDSVPVAFRGPLDGWLAVSVPGRVRVFRTADGGARWRSAIVSPSKAAALPSSDVALVLALDFVNGRDGWLLTSAGGAAAGSQDVELYRTGDGGSSWTLLSANTQQHAARGGIPTIGIKTGIVFATPTRGLVTGYHGQVPGFGVYASADGGRRWRPLALPLPHGYPASSAFPLTFPPSFAGASGVLPTVWPNRRSIVFYRTGDRGARWQPTTPLHSPGGNVPRGWSFPDATHGFVATDTSFCTTTDAAHSWHCVPLPASRRDVTRVQFLTGRLGFELIRGRLFATTDAGINWRPL